MIDRNMIKEITIGQTVKDNSTEIYNLDFNQKECNVCFTNWVEGNIVAEISRCKHSFCVNCLKHWITTNPESGQFCMICRKFVDPNREEPTPAQINNPNNDPGEMPHAIHQGVLDILEENIMEGNDPFEVGRRVQYELQRLNTTDRDMGFQIQDESMISAATIEDSPITESSVTVDNFTEIQDSEDRLSD